MRFAVKPDQQAATPRGFDYDAQSIIGEPYSVSIDDETRWIAPAERSDAIRQQSAGDFDNVLCV
jgi:hypothetical protein